MQLTYNCARHVHLLMSNKQNRRMVASTSQLPQYALTLLYVCCRSSERCFGKFFIMYWRSPSYNATRFVMTVRVSADDASCACRSDARGCARTRHCLTAMFRRGFHRLRAALFQTSCAAALIFTESLRLPKEGLSMSIY